MATISIKGKVVRSGESPQGGTVIHVQPKNPEDLRNIDGTYRAGSDAVAVHVPRGQKAPKLGERVSMEAEEVGAGSLTAFLRHGGGTTVTSGRKATGSNPTAAADEDADEDEVEDEDEDEGEDETEGKGKNV